MAPSPISTLTSKGVPLSNNPDVNPRQFIPSPLSRSVSTCSSFEDTFNFLIQDNLEGKGGFELDSADMKACLKAVMTYNVPQGVHLRGQLVERTYKGLVHDAPENMVQLTRVLGWCVEMKNAAFVIIDDYMDNSPLRQGQPCWHHVDKKGVNAIIDATMLQHVAYQIIRKYFESLPCYRELMDLFLGVAFKTVVGRSLDFRSALNKNNDLGGPEFAIDNLVGDPYDRYNFQLYHSIVRDKHSYYTCYLPVALAMSLAGISQNDNRTLWDNVKNVTQDIGYLLQVQEDYFDSFGDERQVEGRNVNIREGKCTWLFVTAKNIIGQISTDNEQYALLKQNYGKFGDDNVAVVQKLYRELGLPKLFRDYQSSMSTSIIKAIKGLNNAEVETALLHFFVVYK